MVLRRLRVSAQLRARLRVCQCPAPGPAPDLSVPSSGPGSGSFSARLRSSARRRLRVTRTAAIATSPARRGVQSESTFTSKVRARHCGLACDSESTALRSGKLEARARTRRGREFGSWTYLPIGPHLTRKNHDKNLQCGGGGARRRAGPGRAESSRGYKEGQMFFPFAADVIYNFNKFYK
jgi:hypothetical protein